MDAKRNNNNKRTSSRRKKFFQAQRSATVLILFVATIVAIFVGSFRVMSLDCKVLWTQVQMALCYSNIDKFEEIRDSNLDMAYQYPLAAAGYVREAEEADAKIEYWNEVRSKYVHSDDPVIAWAAKDGFELSVFAISLMVFVAFVSLCVAAIRFRSKLFILFQVEVLAFDLIMCGLFYILRFILARFMRLVSHEYNFFDRCWKKDLSDLKSDTQKKFEGETIVPFEFKKSKKRRFKIG